MPLKGGKCMIRVLINSGSPEFRKKLARRLCELSDRLMISLDEGEEDGGNEYDFIIGDEMGKDIFPVSALLNKISAAYSIKEGKPFYGPEKGIRKAFFFTSPYGGSGTSSIAFTFARLLSGKMNEKVLFMDTGRDGLIYGEFTRKAEGKREELLYRINKGRPVEAGRYLSEDYYGPQCISVNAGSFAQTAEALSQNMDITSLVAVSEPEDGIFDEVHIIRVVDIKDARYLLMSDDEDVFTVHNRDYINRVNGRIIYLADDPLSFKTPEGGVRISMDGEFAIGVEKLLREVTGYDGYR
jgi:hypothetical protein